MDVAVDWVSVANELGQDFAARAGDHDRDDSFVAENYAALRERNAFAAGVPADLGGGGASHAELCQMVRALARHCGSTGLAFSMHTHLVGSSPTRGAAATPHRKGCCAGWRPRS